MSEELDHDPYCTECERLRARIPDASLAADLEEAANAVRHDRDCCIQKWDGEEPYEAPCDCGITVLAARLREAARKITEGMK